MNDTAHVPPNVAAPCPPQMPHATPTPPEPDDRRVVRWGAIADALLKDPDTLLSALTGRSAAGLIGRLAALALLGTAVYR